MKTKVKAVLWVFAAVFFISLVVTIFPVFSAIVGLAILSLCVLVMFIAPFVRTI